MIQYKSSGIKRVLLSVLFFVFSVQIINAQAALDGKSLFNAKCASCHNVFKDGTGPKLGGVLESDFYGGDIKKIYHWVYNVGTLVNSDPHYKELKATFNSVMTQFDKSGLPEAEIDAIFGYVNTAFAAGPGGPKKGPGDTGEDVGASSQNAVIFGVISLIMAIIALILMQVNSNLKKLSDDSEGILRPEPVPFYKNKVYIAMFSIFLFILGGYFVGKGAIGLGRLKAYEPKQPIYYSHKVHAGINQINCLYCHGPAYEGKQATIPSTNICMNCHKAITSYEKGPKLLDEHGNEINANAEIAKLYEYAGFDPKSPNTWDPTKAKSIPWERIHSLPDHVYFNHSQHTKAGNVQCQNCHGEINNMDEVYQFSELSMGWCVNCHRQTKVNFYDPEKGTGNKFYSIYEKFHNDIKSGKMDSVTVQDIGGLECQKCHY